jgi:hypothetical protein
MADSPIRIAVELHGIEPNARLQAALDELAATAAELVNDSAEVSGYYTGDADWEVGVWTDMRPNVKSWSFGVERSDSKRIIGVDNDLFE